MGTTSDKCTSTLLFPTWSISRLVHWTLFHYWPWPFWLVGNWLQSLAAASQICFLLVFSKDKCVSIHYVTCHLFSCTEYIVRIRFDRIIDELCHLKSSFRLSAYFPKDLFLDFLFKFLHVVNKFGAKNDVFFLFLNMCRAKRSSSIWRREWKKEEKEAYKI